MSPAELFPVKWTPLLSASIDADDDPVWFVVKDDQDHGSYYAAESRAERAAELLNLIDALDAVVARLSGDTTGRYVEDIERKKAIRAQCVRLLDGLDGDA